MASRGSSRGPGSRSSRPASSRPLGATRRTSESAASTPASTDGWRGRFAKARGNPLAVRGAVLVLIVVVLAGLLTSTLTNWLQQRGDIAALRKQVAAQERTVAELQREQARWQDAAFVEQQARQRLKFVKPGEKSYTVIDSADGEQSLVSGVAGSDGQTQHPWYGAIWDSMTVADVPASRTR